MHQNEMKTVLDFWEALNFSPQILNAMAAAPQK
jgi:hypothetical protein